MNVRVRSVVGSGLLIFGLAAVVGCGRTTPVAPSAASAPATPAAQATSNRVAGPTLRPAGGSEVTFTVEGAFTIANNTGDSLTGTYTGSGGSSGTRQWASLTLQITGGTGVYAGATGTIRASGIGAFSGEGGYSLDARGDAVLPGDKHAQITINLSGTSVASCSSTNQIIITQSGSGTMGRAGRVSSTFQHAVTSGADCIS